MDNLENKSLFDLCCEANDTERLLVEALETLCYDDEEELQRMRKELALLKREIHRFSIGKRSLIN